MLNKNRRKAAERESGPPAALLSIVDNLQPSAGRGSPLEPPSEPSQWRPEAGAGAGKVT